MRLIVAIVATLPLLSWAMKPYGVPNENEGLSDNPEERKREQEELEKWIKYGGAFLIDDIAEKKLLKLWEEKKEKERFGTLTEFKDDITERIANVLRELMGVQYQRSVRLRGRSQESGNVAFLMEPGRIERIGMTPYFAYEFPIDEYGSLPLTESEKKKADAHNMRSKKRRDGVNGAIGMVCPHGGFAPMCTTRTVEDDAMVREDYRINPRRTFRAADYNLVIDESEPRAQSILNQWIDWTDPEKQKERGDDEQWYRQEMRFIYRRLLDYTVRGNGDSNTFDANTGYGRYDPELKTGPPEAVYYIHGRESARFNRGELERRRPQWAGRIGPMNVWLTRLEQPTQKDEKDDERLNKEVKKELAAKEKEKEKRDGTSWRSGSYFNALQHAVRELDNFERDAYQAADNPEKEKEFYKIYVPAAMRGAIRADIERRKRIRAQQNKSNGIETFEDRMQVQQEIIHAQVQAELQASAARRSFGQRTFNRILHDTHQTCRTNYHSFNALQEIQEAKEEDEWESKKKDSESDDGIASREWDSKDFDEDLKRNGANQENISSDLNEFGQNPFDASEDSASQENTSSNLDEFGQNPFGSSEEEEEEFEDVTEMFPHVYALDPETLQEVEPTLSGLRVATNYFYHRIRENFREWFQEDGYPEDGYWESTETTSPGWEAVDVDEGDKSTRYVLELPKYIDWQSTCLYAFLALLARASPDRVVNRPDLFKQRRRAGLRRSASILDLAITRRLLSAEGKAAEEASEMIAEMMAPLLA